MAGSTVGEKYWGRCYIIGKKQDEKRLRTTGMRNGEFGLMNMERQGEVVMKERR